MIPAKEEQLIKFDINKENKKYKQILISQYRFCNKHINEIKNRAKITYQKSKNNLFFKKVCCDFRLLEEKCLEYKEN